MLPLLATVGAGLAWFAATAGQLIFWGAGICVGFWIGKKLTNVWDQWGNKKLAINIFQRRTKEDETMNMGAAVPSTN
jgi:hypothetical protein